MQASVACSLITCTGYRLPARKNVWPTDRYGTGRALNWRQKTFSTWNNEHLQSTLSHTHKYGRHVCECWHFELSVVNVDKRQHYDDAPSHSRPRACLSPQQHYRTRNATPLMYRLLGISFGSVALTRRLIDECVSVRLKIIDISIM